MTAATEERVIYVYALIDPRDRQIRYIGQSQDPIKRLDEHLSELRNTRAAKETELCIGGT